MPKELWLFKIYSTITTLLIAILVFSASRTNEGTKFEEIDVERINIVEKDGRLRIAITNADRFPDAVLNGKTIPRQSGKSPGLIFYNGKGDEAGGLIFDSNTKGKDYSARAALLFDQYNQDETAGVVYQDKNGHRTAAFQVSDHPDTPLSEILEKYEALQKMPGGVEKQEAMQKFQKAAERGDFGADRVFVGKSEDREAKVVLSDAPGRPRIHMAVSASGKAKLEFLDENGKATYTLPQ